MNKNLIIGIVVIIILLVGGYFILTAPTQAPVTENTNQQVNETENTQNLALNEEDIQMEVDVQLPVNHEIIYSDSGYLPTMLAIKTGETVNFQNQGSKGMWTASAMHPTHAVYNNSSLQEHCPDLENDSFDSCKDIQPGQSWSFTFNKKGTWGYHNHSGSNHFGKIIVE